MSKIKVETLVKNLEEIMYNDYHINLGVEREVAIRLKGSDSYLSIRCYTLNGRYKGAYKCGYVDKNGNYFVGKYDEINAETKEYLK